ncbi:MAG: efflux RND transporter permease subunit [Acidobacteria bacterium]|nr:efflux RND transporter permease subunit [Acidobacteriota bacterium]MCB9399478.1 efflux RND transporter permease subunit [Acidobacteriota bacterium]
MRLWDLSIRRPITILMALVCVLVLGLVSLRQLKLAFLPQVDFPAMWVYVSYPNQNPKILEREVTKVLEEGLSTIKGVNKISSDTSADDVQIRLDFKWGMELDLIRLELGLKIEELKTQLPPDIRQIQIFSFNTSDIPVVEGRISAPGIDLSENYDLLEKHVKQKLERVPGVARVDLGGVLPKEVSIELRIDKIKEHNVDVGQVIQRLSRDNITMAGGKIHDRGLVYNIRTMGKVHNLTEFENLPVNDSGLVLKDVADILYEEPPIGYRRHLDGHKALAVVVFKESSANTVDVANGVNAVINGEIAKDPLLNGVNLFVWGDQAKEITNGLNGLTEAGIYGAIFAVVILFLFLRQFRATLIIAASIPISLVGTFILFRAFGFTLNVLTLMGLMLAVGMLVDNAVVVLESIFQKKLAGLSAEEATKQGTKEVIVALIASTATTMVVFLSIVVSDPNELTVWLSAIGLTICFTLGMSLMVSITVIPLFASKLLKGKFKDRKPGGQKLLAWYGRVLDWTLKRPIRTGFGLLLIFLLSFAPFPILSQFKGVGVKTNRIYLQYQFHDFFFLSDVEQVANQVEAYLETKRQEFDLKSIYTWMQENEGTTILTFNKEDVPVEEFKEIRKKLREGLPQIAGVSFMFDDDSSNSEQSIRVQLFGSDSETLEVVEDQIAYALQGIDGLYDVRPNRKSDRKELQVRINRKEAAAFGVTPEQIAQVFGFTLGGTYLPRFQYGDREREVTLGLRIEDRATLADVSQIPIGNGVPLGAVAEFSFEERPGTISRVDRKTYGSVIGTYEGKNMKALMAEIENRLKNFNFPAGVSWSWSDRVLEDENKMGSLFFNIILALLLVYIVLACLFESLIQPILIFITIFFSLFGVTWFLLLTQTEFGVMSFIGLLILLGIVVNNGIMMMDHINHLRDRVLEGISDYTYDLRRQINMEVVSQGAKERIRPILMTASTTIIGLVPMAIGQSAIGDGYYFPLARTVIGGLASSTLLTLIGLPWAIMRWEGIKARHFRRRAFKAALKAKRQQQKEAMA